MKFGSVPVAEAAGATAVHSIRQGDFVLKKGTLIGPAVGATFVVGLEHYLSTSGLPITFIIGLVFIACVMVARRGLYGELRARLASRDAASPKE